MAAKGKYKPDVVAAICEALRNGLTQRRACAVAGINEDTYYAWLKDKPGFSDVVKNAEADCIAANLAIIRGAAKDGNWTASAWILERRFPHEYGRTVQEQAGEQRLVVEVVEARDWRRQGMADVADSAKSGD